MSTQSTSSATILCVDDDSLLLEMLDRVLAKNAYAVLHAQSGEEAMRIILDNPAVDLVLLDVLMPGGIDGIELCRWVRAHERRAYLPIVMLTALGHTDQVARGLDVGADDYITKPFSPREVLARVQAALRVRRIHRELVEAQERYRVLIETSRDVIFALDNDGRLTYISPACEALTGYPPETLLADPTPLVRFVHPEDVPRFTTWLKRDPRAADGADLEFRIVRRDGDLRWGSLSSSAIGDQAGSLVGIQGTLRDITQRKQGEAAAWQRSQELATLNLIASRINQSLELDTMLGEALDALLEVLGIHFGAIYMIEEDRFSLRAARGLPVNTLPDWHGPSDRDAPTDWQSRDLTVVREPIDRAPDQIGSPAKALGIQSSMCVPLREREALNGLLLLASRSLEHFDSTEITLISTAAEQISAAITNSHLYEETRHRLEELALLNEVGRMLTSTLDLDKVLRVIMEATVSMLQGEAGSVMLLDEASGDLIFAAAVGPASEKLPGVRLPAGAGIAGRALQEERALLVVDAQRDAHFFAGIDRVTGLTTHMLMAAPLRTHGRVIGVMEVINKRGVPFTPADLRLLDLLAPTAATAIDNARLYARETQLSEQVRRRNRELNALHAISAALSQSLEIQSVMDVALTMLQSLFEFDDGSIALLDRPDRISVVSQNRSGYTPVSLDQHPLARQFTEQAITARAVKVVANTFALNDDTSAAWREANLGALVAMPLWGHDDVQGVLAMAWREPRDFGDETAPLLAAIGQQIGVAIGRAQLYESAQRRSQEMSTLNTISRSVASTLDLEEVLSAAMQGVREVLAVEAGALLLIDAADGRLRFRKTLGPAGEMIINETLAPGEGIVGWAVQHRQPVLVNDAQHDPRWAARFDRVTEIQTRSVLCVPLLVKDRIIGGFEVLNKLDGPFTEQDVALLQTMAASVAVAIDNARLYQALAESARQIEQSQAQLIQSEKLAATGRLAMSLAHEINNPLQAIQNCLHLALEFPLTEERRNEYLKMAREEVERLSVLVQSMLEFYRASRDGQPSADVRVVLERVLALSDQKLRHNEIELELDFASEPMIVQSAPDQLGQVFLNMVVNAAEAMSAGGHLKITAHPDGDWVEVRFIDDGPGIPSDELPHIFEPFYTTKTEGTGLGLAISYTIVERHGGTIQVNSQIDVGAEFTVRLPKFKPGEKKRRSDQETR